MLVLVMLKNQTITYRKELLSTPQSAISVAPTVFFRLPSLMAADEPCTLSQPSLRGVIFLTLKKPNFVKKQA